MKTGYIVLSALGLALSTVCFFFGHRLGSEKTTQIQRARFFLTRDVDLYQCLEDGKLGRMKNNLAISILAEVRYYEYAYGKPSGSNHFTRLFEEASLIASDTESRLVPLKSAFTNIPGGSNVIIGVKRDDQ